MKEEEDDTNDCISNKKKKTNTMYKELKEKFIKCSFGIFISAQQLKH